MNKSSKLLIDGAAIGGTAMGSMAAVFAYARSTVILFAIFLLLFSPPPAAAFSSSSCLTSAYCCCYCWRRFRLSRLDSTKSSSSDENDDLAPLQRRLQLTSDQITLIRNRIGGITPPKKDDKQNCNNDVKTSSTAVLVETNNTIERNLAYLEEHWGMTIEQLQRVVVGYPLVLTMKLETNLIPTIEFFGDALLLCDDNDVVIGDVHHDQESNKKRLSAFLCEDPRLLEYNVAKRLKPRLERLGSAQHVNEEMLHSIATLTDSRFETWLLQQMSTGPQSNDNNETTEVSNDNTARSNINHPSAYVIVSNLQSGSNIGNIVRSASIFGCEECIVVGQKRYRMSGDHGSRLDLPQRHMWSHADVRDYLHNKRVRIYGIEIMENATPIMQYDRETGVVKFPFESECEGGWLGSAFIFGNEGQGLSTKQREICDEFLFIPQNRGGSRDDYFAGRGGGGGATTGGGSASMNVACAAAVVLQAYCMWAGYSVARCEGEKFLA